MDMHKSKMSSGEVTVPASSFNQQTDRNIQPSPTGISIGGIPTFWLSSQPISRRDMTANSTPIGSNPRIYKVIRFEEFHSGKYQGNPTIDK
jgi:hypothetical protein